jgi:hypothetical protein
MNGGHHVGHVSASGDQTRSAANHGVVDFAGFLVARVGGLDPLAPELAFELIDGFLLHGSLLHRNIRFDFQFVLGGVREPF